MILFVILLVLAGAIYWLLEVAPARQMQRLVADREFAVENTDQIRKIFLAHRDGETVLLERRGDGWTYNGQYDARPNAVDNLLDAVSRVQMQYKPPQAAVPNMVNDLAVNGIKVELYGAGDRLLKAYYVGGSTADERGTYMIMEGAEQPYVAHIPSWTGNLRFRYNLRGEDWRDRTVLRFDPDQVTSASIDYPKQQDQSFRLESKDGQWAVLPFYPTTPQQVGTLQPGRVEAFLVAASELGAEAFRNNFSGKDSLLQQAPFATFRVQLAGTAEPREVCLYPIFPEVSVFSDAATASRANATVERYFAWVEPAGDLLLVQNRVFRKALWGYASFFEN